MNTTNQVNMTHSIRRVKEYLAGSRETLKLTDFEAVMTVIEEQGYLADYQRIVLLDSFRNFEERIHTKVILTPEPSKDRYRITFEVESELDNGKAPIEVNTVLIYSFKDQRLHQEIDLGQGVIVKSTIPVKVRGAFCSTVRSRLCVTKCFNLNVKFRVDQSLFEGGQLVRAAGYEPNGVLVSITGKGRCALVEDYVVCELGYVPLDKELTNVFN